MYEDFAFICDRIQARQASGHQAHPRAIERAKHHFEERGRLYQRLNSERRDHPLYLDILCEDYKSAAPSSSSTRAPVNFPEARTRGQNEQAAKRLTSFSDSAQFPSAVPRRQSSGIEAQGVVNYFDYDGHPPPSTSSQAPSVEAYGGPSGNDNATPSSSNLTNTTVVPNARTRPPTDRHLLNDNMRTLLSTLGREPVNVGGGNDSLYRAVSWGMFSNEDEHQGIRMSAVRELQHNEELYGGTVMKLMETMYPREGEADEIRMLATRQPIFRTAMYQEYVYNVVELGNGRPGMAEVAAIARHREMSLLVVTSPHPILFTPDGSSKRFDATEDGEQPIVLIHDLSGSWMATNPVHP